MQFTIGLVFPNSPHQLSSSQLSSQVFHPNPGAFCASLACLRTMTTGGLSSWCHVRTGSWWSLWGKSQHLYQPDTTHYKWQFLLDGEPFFLHRILKWLFNQRSVLNWLFKASRTNIESNPYKKNMSKQMHLFFKLFHVLSMFCIIFSPKLFAVWDPDPWRASPGPSYLEVLHPRWQTL